MPHKRNPHKSERICGLTRIVRSLYSAQAENIAVEHERDLTNSAPERITFSDMISLTDYILVELKNILQSLQLDHRRIEENLHLMQGRQMAEAVMIHIANKIGTVLVQVSVWPIFQPFLNHHMYLAVMQLRHFPSGSHGRGNALNLRDDGV